jgi:hypothetical protein
MSAPTRKAGRYTIALESTETGPIAHKVTVTTGPVGTIVDTLTRSFADLDLARLVGNALTDALRSLPANLPATVAEETAAAMMAARFPVLGNQFANVA